jgi:hypothetical protein
VAADTSGIDEVEIRPMSCKDWRLLVLPFFALVSVLGSVRATQTGAHSEKSLSKHLEVLERRAAGCKDTDPWNLPRLLRPSGERRGKENRTRACQERAPVHH